MIGVREAARDDAVIITDLLVEIEEYYGTVDSPPREQWRQQIESLLFCVAPVA